MKAALLLLLTLRCEASAPSPPAVRVTFSPMTRVAYEQALKSKLVTKPHVTFPLKKQHGRLVIPSAKGTHVLRDGWVDGEYDEDTRYEYRGYWPRLHWHIVDSYHYGETFFANVLTQNGQWLKLGDAPVLAPDASQFVVASGSLDGMVTPSLQLFWLKKGTWQQVWEVAPASWETQQVNWVSPTTLLLQQKHWNKDFSRAWYTYVKLTVR